MRRPRRSRPNTLLGLAAACLIGACQHGGAALAPDDPTIGDIAAIERASDLWVETYNRNDWTALAALFTPDAILMPPNGEAVRGRAAIAEWEQENETGFRIALVRDAVHRFGELAHIHGRSCVFIPDGSGGYGVDVGKFAELRRRQADGYWLIEVDIFNSDLPPGSELRQTCPFAPLPGAGS
ncbi:MAG: DUF4440 domain-containing protein [Litorimonas sp.]